MEEKRLDWNARLVQFFYDNSRLVWLIIVSVLIAGGASLASLRREGFPSVSIKTVAVQAIYPGATSTEVESKVTKELEAAIKDAKGMKDFSSTSSNSFAMLQINFDESVSLDQAVQDVQSKISAVKGNLPEEVEQPKILTWSTSGPAFVIGVTSRSDEESRVQAKKIAEEIGAVPGVKKAETSEHAPRITINLRLADMEARGISPSTVSQLLTASNVNFPTGIIEIDGKSQSTIAMGTFNSISDIENIIVGVDPVTHLPVAIKNIASVEETTEASKQIERIGYLKDGELVAESGQLIQVTLTSEADFIKTRAQIEDQIANRQEDGAISKEAKTVMLYDQAQQTEDQIREIIEGTVGAKKNLYLLGGLQLLFIAMLLLVNWRAALISALSIPFSFAITFIFLALTGTQLNTIVLFSFVLVLGLVVDPAIVMIEAIQRYRDLKYESREAVIEAGRRYGASIFLAVLTSLLVFVPFGVVSGYFGEIIKYLPLTVIPALVASYFVPMALLPYLTRKLLKYHEHDRKAKKTGEEEELSQYAEFVMRVNRWVLGKTWRKIAIFTTAVFLVVASISIIGLGKVQVVQFASPEDNTMLSIQATFNKGLTQSDKESAAKSIENLLVAENGIKEFYYIEQSNDGYWMYVNLKDQTEREAEADKSKAIVKHLRDKITGNQYFADLIIGEIAMGPPTGAFQIQTQLATNDLKKLESASKAVGAFLATLDHVEKVDDGFSGKKDSQIEIQLDRQKMQLAGLTSAEVGMQLKGVIDETAAGKFDDGVHPIREIYLTNAKKPVDVHEIKNITLASRTGAVVKVGDIATVTTGEGVGVIERYNGARFATIKARVDDTKNVMAVQKEFDKYLTDEKLKSLGIDSKVTKGDIGDITKSFTELGIALVVAVVMTYIVLVLQFKSFSYPGIMLFTIPLSLIGVFPALWAVGSQFGFLELLGITILVGIVENVAIFLIDYANQLRKEKGLSAKEAIIQASGVRFRPILLTKLVALGGLLPLAIESDFWRGLSVVIIAGIGLSGFFSLIIIPILYVWISSLRDRIHKTA